MDCTIENKKLSPLNAVTNAAIVDMYEDAGKYFHRANFMAARGLKKLYNESLPRQPHKVWLHVNTNTHTATLPLDYDEIIFVGFLDSRWHRVPLKSDTSIVDRVNIIDIPCEDKCDKCNQDKGICNDLIVTVESNLIVINDTTYEETITKKLYPNGDYYLEKSTPVLDIETDEINYSITKEFITNFDLKPCGCLETSDTNIDSLRMYCPDIYCGYYAPCDNRCNLSYGGYRIFEESGLIQFDSKYPFDKCYIEYYGFITKKNGKYYIPSISFETLVEWTKFKLIQNKKSVSLSEREWQKQNYIRERGNMMKVMGRFSLSMIVQAISSLPKFDIGIRDDWYDGCFSRTAGIEAATAAAQVTSVNTDCCTTTTFINRTAFTLAVKVNGEPGNPVDGQSTYQNNILKGATDLTYIFLAKQILTRADEDFDFDASTGTIDISPNKFFTGDSLIANYNKNL
jgi:hypothetical protein